jgi:hypothetical protein
VVALNVAVIVVPDASPDGAWAEAMAQSEPDGFVA